MSGKIQATATFCLFGGRIEAHEFGRPHNWQLTGDESQDTIPRIALIAQEIGLKNIYAPRPSDFNGLVCTPDELGTPIQLGEGEDTPILWRGCDADGVVIPAGAAFWLSSADCFTIIAHDPETGTTAAAHAGRDSVINRRRISDSSERQNRSFESVVDAIVARFSKEAVPRLKVFMTCGVGPESFGHPLAHPQAGEENRRLVEDILANWGPTCLSGNPSEGKICLSELIRLQFLALGTPAHHIGYDAADTCTDTDEYGEHLWWSYQRGDDLKRNGILVIRKW